MYLKWKGFWGGATWIGWRHWIKERGHNSFQTASCWKVSLKAWWKKGCDYSAAANQQFFGWQTQLMDVIKMHQEELFSPSPSKITKKPCHLEVDSQFAVLTTTWRNWTVSSHKMCGTKASNSTDGSKSTLITTFPALYLLCKFKDCVLWKWINLPQFWKHCFSVHLRWFLFFWREINVHNERWKQLFQTGSDIANIWPAWLNLKRLFKQAEYLSIILSQRWWWWLV